LKIIAAMEDPPVIVKILSHLWLPSSLGIRYSPSAICHLELSHLFQTI